MGGIDLRQEVATGTDKALQHVVSALRFRERGGSEDAPDGMPALLVTQVHAGIVVEIGLGNAHFDAVPGFQRQGKERNLAFAPLGDEMLGVSVLEGAEELLFDRLLIPRHVRHIGLIIIREGEFRLLIGDGEFPRFSPAHEAVGDAVVIRPEHDVVVPRAEGQFVKMVTDTRPLVVLRRDGRVHAPAGNMVNVVPAHAGTVQEHHGYLGRIEQFDAIPHNGIRNIGSIAHRHDNLPVRRSQFIVLGLRHHGRHEGGHHQNKFFHLSLVFSD